MSENSFEYGISKVVLYVKKTVIEENAITDYEYGHAWNGMIDIMTEASGYESTPICIGEFVYDILKSPEDFSGTIRAYTYPDDFELCDGSIDSRAFGLCYKTENSDGSFLIHLLYNCYGVPSDREWSTVNDSAEAVEFEWNIGSTFTEVNTLYPLCEIVLDSREVEDWKLEYLQELLYGTDESEPILPNPYIVIWWIHRQIRVKKVPYDAVIYSGSSIDYSGIDVEAFVAAHDADYNPFIEYEKSYRSVPYEELLFPLITKISDEKYSSKDIALSRDVTYGDVAISMFQNDDQPSILYAIVIDDGIAKIYKRQIYRDYDYEWSCDWTFGPASSAAIEYNGDWRIEEGSEWYRLYTEEHPYIFTVEDGALYAQYWNDSSTRTLLSQDVENSISACRGWQSSYDSSLDQGIVVAYIRNGEIYYRSLCYFEDDGSLIWENEKKVTELGIGNNWVSVFRTIDYRIGILGESNGHISLALTRRTWPSRVIRAETLRAYHTANIYCNQMKVYNDYSNREYISPFITHAYFMLDQDPESPEIEIDHYTKHYSDDGKQIVSITVTFNMDIYGPINGDMIKETILSYYVEKEKKTYTVPIQMVYRGLDSASLMFQFNEPILKSYEITLDIKENRSLYYYRSQNQKWFIPECTIVVPPEENYLYGYSDNEYISARTESNIFYYNAKFANYVNREYIDIVHTAGLTLEPIDVSPI